jgi:hypothetical protein
MAGDCRGLFQGFTLSHDPQQLGPTNALVLVRQSQ